MEIIVNNNLMKLLAPAFLHVSPAKKGAIVANHSYRITTKEYGEMGTALCTWTFSCQLIELHKYLLFLSEDGGHFLTEMKKQGALNTDPFQMSVFKFQKRRSSAFTTLYEEQAPRVGIDIIKQQSLFNG